MPDLPDANRHEDISASEEIRRIEAIQKSFSQGSPKLRKSRQSDKENDSQTDRRGLGCEAKTALRQWHEFARSHPGFSLTGQREFSSDLDLILVAENEAQSLGAFVKTLNLDGVGILQDLAEKRARKTIGSEHVVFLDSVQKRVFKLTRAGKYGRIRDTPSQYLHRLALMNFIAPNLDIRFEDFIANQSKESSFLTSMSLFEGKQPSPKRVDQFLRGMGFAIFSDRSGTMDYLHSGEGLVFRDCHAANWIEAQGNLVPIDIIPEWVQQDRDDHL